MIRRQLASGSTAVLDPKTRKVVTILRRPANTTRPPDNITLRLHMHYAAKYRKARR